MRPDALDIVLETLEALTESLALPERSRCWLRDGLAGLLDGEELAVALDIKPGNGQAPVDRQYRLLIRDRYLCAAWKQCNGTPWQRSMELAAQVKRFACRVWPRVCNQVEPPDRFDDIDNALFWAFRICDGDIPNSAKRLGQIVNGNERSAIRFPQTVPY